MKSTRRVRTLRNRFFQTALLTLTSTHIHCISIDDFMMISYDQSLVQILSLSNHNGNRCPASNTDPIPYIFGTNHIVLLWNMWNLIRFLSLKLTKLFLDNFT